MIVVVYEPEFELAELREAIALANQAGENHNGK